MEVMTVREGRKVWPFCGECGCRLDMTPLKYGNMTLVEHFNGECDNIDARGCRCSNINRIWHLENYNG